MSFLDSGFDEFLEKSVADTSNQLSAQDQDALLSDISGDKIIDGVLSSSDGKSTFSLDRSIYKVNDGVIDRVEIGRFSDGEYGLRIRDRDGNLLMDITGLSNVMQSKTGKMQIDFDKEQARWFDEKDLRILIGKEKGLF